jgi:uncharacterized protein YjbJ (UPF0337 family)
MKHTDQDCSASVRVVNFIQTAPDYRGLTIQRQASMSLPRLAAPWPRLPAGSTAGVLPCLFQFQTTTGEIWTRIESRAPRSRPKGDVKEAAGKVTGDAKLEGEGKADKAAGKVQNAVGGLKATLRGK